ncbi:hypothetical protein GYMLUDRAFT_46320 [Collybiopsis luxurians FD-317 M1]|uniref:Uncharacterized protein n=1 Tax=Collybiopsis luxurians FD-317 M1 TaxID=944289 RepID=A0A0D0BQM5_9AGAR|nr:hypothetical protein GYMLUDRAFT_46320 [Collybiopsis luxurians FD-317 M1]
MFHVDPKASLVSLWVETFFFGLHLILFVFCVWVLLRHRREGYVILITTAFCIIGFSATHVILNFRDSLVILHQVSHGDHGSHHCHPEGGHFFGLNARSFAYLMNNFFADALVVYRCYALWSSNAEYFLAFPALMVLITTMVGTDGDPCKEALQLRPQFFILALVTNLTVTFLAAGRLYWLTRNREWHILGTIESELFRRYRKAFMILVESGGLYSLALGLFLILCDGNANEGAALIVQSSLAQIMGIVPTSIIVIVGLGKEFSSQSDEETRDLLPKSSRHSRGTSLFSKNTRTYSRKLDPNEVMNIV